MVDKKDPTNPSVTSDAYDTMAPRWARAETLMGGTEAMRAAGDLYLPIHPAESEDNYADRLLTNVLFNMYELTANSLVSKVFSRPIKLSDDMPEDLANFTEDIDMQGNALSVFARQIFRDGLTKSMGHILIDMPALTEEERLGRTLLDDTTDGRRPFWAHIAPENVISIRSQIIRGVEFLTEVRIFEHDIVPNGFVDEYVPQIRVLFPGGWQIWREEKKRGRGQHWFVYDEGETSLDFIPFVTFYTNRDGVMLGKPPLDDLAHLNIRHWQSNSDQINILTVTRFPMLAVSGVTAETTASVKIGPRTLLSTKDAQGRYYYVEHAGKAMDKGREELIDLETEMAAYGAQFLVRKTGNVTATKDAIRSAESTTVLQDYAIRFTDTLNLALAYTNVWLGRDVAEVGTVDLDTSFLKGIDGAEFQALMLAREKGDITGVDFINELKRRDILSAGVIPLTTGLRDANDMGTRGTPAPAPVAPVTEEDEESDDE